MSGAVAPARWGRYRVRHRFDRGRYVAWDSDLQRDVLVVLTGPPRPAAENQRDALARFAHMHGPAFGRVHDSGGIDGCDYWVTDIPAGTSLATWITSPRSVAQRCRVAVQMAEAVRALHRAGLSHGQLTPQSIYIDRFDVLGIAPPEELTGTQALDREQLRSLLERLGFARLLDRATATSDSSIDEIVTRLRRILHPPRRWGLWGIAAGALFLHGSFDPVVERQRCPVVAAPSWSQHRSDRVEQTGNRYVESWHAAHARVCTIDDPLRRERGLACLQRRAAGLDHLRGLVGQDTPAVAVLTALHRLERPIDCFERDWNGPQPSPELAEDIEESFLLDELGFPERALSRAEAIARQADAAASVADRIAAKSALVGLLAHRDPARAEALALETVRLSESIGDDYERARALKHLGNLHGQGAQPGASDLAIALGLAAVSRVGGADGVRVALLNALGNLRRSQSHFAEAEAAYQEGLRLASHRFPERLMLFHANLASMLRDAGRLDEALAHAKEAILVGEREFGPHTEAVSRAHNVLSEIHQKRGEFPLALTAARRAVEAAETADASPTCRSYALGSLAASLDGLDRSDDALPQWKRCADLAEQTFGSGHPIAFTCRLGYGACLRKLGRVGAARREFEALLPLQGAPVVGGAGLTASLFAHLTEIALELGATADAREYAERMIEAAKAPGGGYENHVDYYDGLVAKSGHSSP